MPKLASQKLLQDAVTEYLNLDKFAQKRKNGQAGGSEQLNKCTFTVLLETAYSLAGHRPPTVADFSAPLISATVARLKAGDTDAQWQARRMANPLYGKRRTGLGTGALNTARSHLRCLAAYLMSQGDITKDPTYGLKSVDANKTDKTFSVVPESDFDELLDTAGLRHPRDRMAVALGLFFGRRESEVLSLQIEDWNREEKVLYFVNHKKGGARTGLPVLDELQTELERYFAWIHAEYGDPDDPEWEPDPEWYLLPHRPRHQKDCHRGVTVNPNTPVVWTEQTRRTRISTDIKIALEAIGFEDVTGKGMHTLRRTMACFLIAKVDRGDLRGDGQPWTEEDIRDFLDHEDLKTTFKYTRHNLKLERMKKKHAGGSMRNSGPVRGPKTATTVTVPNTPIIHQTPGATVIDLNAFRYRGGLPARGRRALDVFTGAR